MYVAKSSFLGRHGKPKNGLAAGWRRVWRDTSFFTGFFFWRLSGDEFWRRYVNTRSSHAHTIILTSNSIFSQKQKRLLPKVKWQLPIRSNKIFSGNSATIFCQTSKTMHPKLEKVVVQKRNNASPKHQTMHAPKFNKTCSGKQ